MSERIVSAPRTEQRYERLDNRFCAHCGAKGLWAQLQIGDSAHTGLYGCPACGEIFALDIWVQDRDFNPRWLEQAEPMRTLQHGAVLKVKKRRGVV